MASSEDINLEATKSGDHDEVVISAITSIEVAHTRISDDSISSTSVEHIDAFDFYSCEEAIKRLNDYLDSEMLPGEKEDVLKHLQICAPCLERFHFEKSLIVAMREKMCRSMAPLKLKERLKSLIIHNQ